MAATKRTKTAKKSTATANGGLPLEWIPVEQLLFDPQNPRLVEALEGGAPSQDDLLRMLWEHMAVDELAMSIAASGYFEYEPLFAIKERKKNYVIEGNRRLAAVKLLLSKSYREKVGATDLPSTTAAQRKKLERLPVIYTTREAAWQYLGFKHVNGPAKWDSYAKAQYIAEVHTQYGVPLEDIAGQIGDRHKTVQRLYRALMVIKQAEAAKVFKRADRYRDHFSFSHLYTGLDYTGIASFIGIRDESTERPDPIPKKFMKELGELCTWLYGDGPGDVPPVVQSQNPHLRQLDEVLADKRATESLRAGMPLSVALEVSYGDERIFQTALLQAKEALQKARGTLSTGYAGEEEYLRLANLIFELADDLLEEMERKKTRTRRRRKAKKAN